MFLRRIQVPNFRALKDVDITFEPEFSPHIFPLGSLNGGGKSTLLQLIFVLLSCSGDPEKHIFIQNMLDGFEGEEKEKQKELATIYLTDNEREIKLQFFCHANEFIIDPIELTEELQYLADKTIRFSMIDSELKVIDYEISKSKQKKANLIEKQQKIRTIQKIQDEKQRNQVLKKEIDSIKYGEAGSFFRSFLKIKRNNSDIDVHLSELVDLEKEINRKIQEEEIYLEELNLERDKLQIGSKYIAFYLQEKKLLHICNYISFDESKKQEYALLFNTESIDINKVNELLDQLSTKLFLAAPFTQVFLFLPKDRTKLLFKESNRREKYYSTLEETKRKLPNLFTYDILSVDFIIESFKAARDKDFQQAIESGEYGDAYQSILKELNSLLGNKKINIDSDLSGVNFKIDRNGENQELYPEDLSHGELKRLSIYVWLKYKNIENSIVLMDEIENAFHPDWQYQIISDLAEWGASNQYILATHSYELCQALTPAHVKELEPKLLADKQVNK